MFTEHMFTEHMFTHKVAKPFRICHWLNARNQILILFLEIDFEKSFNLFVAIPQLQIINNAKMIYFREIFR